MKNIVNPRLTPEHVNEYKREGYFVYREPVLPENAFQGLKSHFEKKLENLAIGTRPESMDVPHFTDPALFQWLFADEILDLIEPIIGPDICLFSSHFICKPKGNGKRVPWHEDTYYWKGMMDHPRPVEVVTVWLAIDPSTKENGCMHVIPRTHDNGDSEYDPADIEKNIFSTEIKRHLVDESKAVGCILQPNQASLHDGRIIHGSAPNTSHLRRCGYTMRYTSTAIKHIPTPTHQVYLARGRDLAGNTYADPSQSYPHLARYREKHGKNGH